MAAKHPALAAEAQAQAQRATAVGVGYRWITEQLGKQTELLVTPQAAFLLNLIVECRRYTKGTTTILAQTVRMLTHAGTMAGPWSAATLSRTYTAMRSRYQWVLLPRR